MNKYKWMYWFSLLAWAVLITVLMVTPVRSTEIEIEKPTIEDMKLEAVLAISDVTAEAQEPVVIIYPYYDVPLSHKLQEDLRCACDSSGIDMVLALSVIQKETNFQNIIGDNGDSFGYMQVQPKWHEERMKRLEVVDLMDPLSNFRVGCDYLAELLSRYNLQDALTFYNSGTTGTSDYSNSVLENMEVMIACEN